MAHDAQLRAKDGVERKLRARDEVERAVGVKVDKPEVSAVRQARARDDFLERLLDIRAPREQVDVRLRC